MLRFKTRRRVQPVPPAIRPSLPTSQPAVRARRTSSTARRKNAACRAPEILRRPWGQRQSFLPRAAANPPLRQSALATTFNVSALKARMRTRLGALCVRRAPPRFKTRPSAQSARMERMRQRRGLCALRVRPSPGTGPLQARRRAIVAPPTTFTMRQAGNAARAPTIRCRLTAQQRGRRHPAPVCPASPRRDSAAACNVHARPARGATPRTAPSAALERSPAPQTPPTSARRALLASTRSRVRPLARPARRGIGALRRARVRVVHAPPTSSIRHRRNAAWPARVTARRMRELVQASLLHAHASAALLSPARAIRSSAPSARRRPALPAPSSTAP